MKIVFGGVLVACTSPNRSKVEAIDNPDQFEEAFDTDYISETSEKVSWTTFRWSVLRKCTFLVVIWLLLAIVLTVTFTKGNITT